MGWGAKTTEKVTTQQSAKIFVAAAVDGVDLGTAAAVATKAIYKINYSNDGVYLSLLTCRSAVLKLPPSRCPVNTTPL